MAAGIRIPWRSPAARGIGLLLLALAASVGLRAQAVPEPALKAAFLYRFAMFTDWPADALPADAPITFCVADSAIADALDSTVAGKAIGQHRLVVQRIKLPAPLRACAVLYAGVKDVKNAIDLVNALQGLSVLSVADFDQFTFLGGVAHFFREDDRIRFAINVQAAERARLRLSSKLLTLAKIVKDGSRGLH